MAARAAAVAAGRCWAMSSDGRNSLWKCMQEGVAKRTVLRARARRCHAGPQGRHAGQRDEVSLGGVRVRGEMGDEEAESRTPWYTAASDCWCDPPPPPPQTPKSNCKQADPTVTMVHARQRHRPHASSRFPGMPKSPDFVGEKKRLFRRVTSLRGHGV